MPTSRLRRLYLDPAEFGLQTHELVEERAHRLLTVLRLPVGAPLSVFDGLGHERDAVLLEARRGRATIALGADVEPMPETPVSVSVCAAYPRGARGDWLVEKATELGAASFVSIESDRAVMRAGDGRFDRWRRIAIEAAEQCGRAVVPTFLDAPPAGALSLVADLDAASSPAEALALVSEHALEPDSVPRAIALYVGPEGGWTDDERAAHEAAGFIRVGLGPRVLRVETAAIALLTLTVEALRGR